LPQFSHKTMKKNNMIKSTKKKETMKKYKIIIHEEFTVEAENEDDAIFDAVDSFDFGSIRPDVEEIEEIK
jgi:hypothetical protein